MAWIQKTTPILDDSFLTVTDGAGHILTDWYCWCLAVTQASFGINEAKYSSAWECWNRNQDKYPDSEGGMNIPIGIYVPVFFTGGQYGHVVVAYRESYDKIYIWSSPYTHKPYFDTFSGDVVSTIKKVENIYGCKYVGWTATLTGKRIVQWGDPVPSKPELNFTAYDEPIGYEANLQPTHLWDVSEAVTFDQVKDLRTIDKGTGFWAWGTVYNKQLGQTYLVDKECLEKKIAKGYNIGDMVIPVKEEVENTETPVLEPVDNPVENSEPTDVDPVENPDEYVDKLLDETKENTLLVRLINRLIEWLKSLIA